MAKREIVITQSTNGHWWARHGDHQSVFHDPSGYGHTKEQAIANLAIDQGYIEEPGKLKVHFDIEG